MKRGWELKELDDVCYFENGDRGKNYPSKKHYISSGIPFITAANVEDGYILENLNYISKERYNLLSRGKFKKNDFLFCLRGSLGKFGYVNNDIIGGIASSMVIVRTQDKLIDRWLHYYFISSICQREIENRKGGAAQPNLGAKDLKRFQIPIPPLEEQKQIVEILDEAFEAIDQAQANIEKNIENAQELFQSKLNDIFSQKGEGWEEKSLKDACIKITDGSHHSPKNLYPNKQDGLFKYITSKNIRNNFIDLSNVQYVDESFHNTNFKRCFPELGDVLLTKDGANTGNVTNNTLEEPFSLLSSVALIKTDKEILLPEFLKFYIQSPIGFKSITGKMTGAAIKRIILRDIKSAKMFIPNIDEQVEYIRESEKMLVMTNYLNNHYQQKLSNLEDLKKSILQKAFAGELTNKDR